MLVFIAHIQHPAFLCAAFVCSMQRTFSSAVLLALLVLAGSAAAQSYKKGEWIAGRAT